MTPKVHVVEDITRQVYAVYVEEPRAHGDDFGSRWFRAPDGIVEVAAGAEAPVYARIDTRIAHALAGVLEPRPAATEAHLADVTEVRDRLLSLVEHVVHPLDPKGQT